MRKKTRKKPDCRAFVTTLTKRDLATIKSALDQLPELVTRFSALLERAESLEAHVRGRERRAKKPVVPSDEKDSDGSPARETGPLYDVGPLLDAYLGSVPDTSKVNTGSLPGNGR
jgi:hypothetical protein